MQPFLMLKMRSIQNFFLCTLSNWSVINFFLFFFLLNSSLSFMLEDFLNHLVLAYSRSHAFTFILMNWKAMVICEFPLLGEGTWSRAKGRGEPFSSQAPYIYLFHYNIFFLLPSSPLCSLCWIVIITNFQCFA